MVEIALSGSSNHTDRYVFYNMLPCIIRFYVIIDYLLLSLLDTTLQMTKIISC